MSVHILMNVVDEQEMRVALIRDGHLDTILHERINPDHLQCGNIYKAKVANVEPSLDAAFLDVGGAKNAFIHVDEVPHDAGPKARIEQILRPGQEIIVQVTKEAIKDKGACVTGHISIPGRYLVLVQDPEGLGVSKRIEDPAVRRRLKSLLASFEPPTGFGYIVRTAGAERSDEEISLDQEYLSRLWQEIDAKAKRVKAPACIYQESDVVLRTLREMADEPDVSVIIDSERYYDEARAFAMVFMPELEGRIQLHREDLPVMTYYGVEERLATIYDRKVPMPSGGNIVIEQTEAMVTIDVNSARSREGADVHATALQTNLEAALAIAEQLKLRDLGGLVVIDFIDMDSRDHQRLVQLALRRALLSDKARTQVASMSRFGLVEMTRQRTRPSHKMFATMECPHCKGTGAVKTPETFEIEVMRAVRQTLNSGNVAKLDVVVPSDLAVGLLNSRSAEIVGLEREYDCRISFSVDPLIKTREYRLQPTTRKRGGGRRGQQEKPVHSGLLADWMQAKMQVKAQVKELQERGPAAIEQELLDHANGRTSSHDTSDTPVVAKVSQAPGTTADSPSAPVPAGPPTILEEAQRLRQLLFTAPSPTPVMVPLASSQEGAKPRRSSRTVGNGRRRRRGSRS
ncbi:MAG: Rne/Rng family ribonuclease [Planctomycetota bacterium]|nr:MAG: Rne/Rng family ribonuclease [Planctomycetota bacterium]